MNTTAQVKQAIKKSVQQVKQEPLELLRTATRQISGEEERPEQQEPPKSENNEAPPEEIKYKKQVAEQDGRRLEALNSEIQDITRQKIFNDLMRRIQGGEDVPVEEFSELSFEQKDVLKAQVEAVKTQRLNSQNTSTFPEPGAKKGRKMGGGQKGAAKKEQTRVEKPVPPSG
jgi:hypothetical protein